MTRNCLKINWRTRKTRLVFPYSPSKHVTKGPSLRGLGYSITCSLWNTLYVKLITSIEKPWIKVDEPILHRNNRCRWELNWSGLFSSNCNTNSCFSVPVWFELNFFLVVSKLSVIVFYALFFSHHYSKFCFLHLIKISILHMLQVKLPCTTRMPIQRTFLAKNSPKKPMKVENTLKQYT